MPRQRCWLPPAELGKLFGPSGDSAWLLYLDDLPSDALDELLADARRPLLGSVIDDMVDR